jgi:UDP-N-acetylmuramoyl-tripeptide--D-alanyl-D-alanine ligase
MISTEEIYNLYLDHPKISTDSRNVIPGSLFFAIKGDNFDGNRFVVDALKNGAAYAIIDNPVYNCNERCILVPDTIKSLQQLAILHRNRIQATIIGITGSNGKTTTKELIGKVLSSTFKTVMTRGNLNNHIGVPLTILSIKNDTDFAVIEMGANHPGEIAALCQIAKPEFGIITNIGKAHLEGFGSFEGVINAKSELYDFIKNNDGRVFINNDNPLLVSLCGEMKFASYGTSENASCKGEIISKDPYLVIKWQKDLQNGLINSNLFGDYNFENIMAAVCIGSYFGISQDTIDGEIGNYHPDNNRSQWIQTERNTLILDAYNANPSSMKAAISNFSRISAPAKMVILGDMMELGDQSPEEHQNIIRLVSELSLQNAVFIGKLFSNAAEENQGVFFAGISEAETWFQSHPVNNYTILLKGSRKMQLETLVKLL